MTIEELIGALKRSNSPTLIVEGSDDYVAFTGFEIENVRWGLTILPVRGTENIRRIIRELDEIDHPALAFLLDRDLSVFPGISPSHYAKNIFYTHGYSIENDLVQDGELYKLLKPEEREVFDRELDLIFRFYICAVDCHINCQNEFALSTMPSQLLNDNGLREPYKQWMQDREGRLRELSDFLSTDPKTTLRGKNLIALLVRHLSAPRRKSKFSAANLLEIGATKRGQLLRMIENDVLSYFRTIGVADA